MDKENGKWAIETLEGEEEELMELEDKGFLDGQKPGSHLEEQNLDKAKEPGKWWVLCVWFWEGEGVEIGNKPQNNEKIML